MELRVKLKLKELIVKEDVKYLFRSHLLNCHNHHLLVDRVIMAAQAPTTNKAGVTLSSIYIVKSILQNYNQISDEQNIRLKNI